MRWPRVWAAALALSLGSAGAVQVGSILAAEELPWPGEVIGSDGTDRLWVGDDWLLQSERRWWGEATLAQWGWPVAALDPPRGREILPRVPDRRGVLRVMGEMEQGQLLQRSVGFPCRAWAWRQIGPRGEERFEARFRWGHFGLNWIACLIASLPLAAGLQLAASVLIGDVIMDERRARGRCGACGYEMKREGSCESSAAAVCPECGARQPDPDADD